MNDRVKEILEKMLKRLDLVTLGALLALLILSGWMYLREKNYLIAQPEAPQRRTFTVKLPVPAEGPGQEAPAAANAAELATVEAQFLDDAPTLEEAISSGAAPGAVALLRKNMFLIRSAAEQEEDREALTTRVREAERLMSAGELDAALLVVQEVLAQDRNNVAARDLQRQIETRKASASP